MAFSVPNPIFGHWNHVRYDRPDLQERQLSASVLTSHRYFFWILMYIIFYIHFYWFSFFLSIFLCRYYALTPRGLSAPLIQLFHIYSPLTVPCDAPTNSALVVFSPLRFRCVFFCAVRKFVSAYLRLEFLHVFFSTTTNKTLHKNVVY